MKGEGGRGREKKKNSKTIFACMGWHVLQPWTGGEEGEKGEGGEGRGGVCFNAFFIFRFLFVAAGKKKEREKERGKEKRRPAK